MGYVFRDGEWMAPPIGWPSPAAAEADAMHVLLVLRADQLDGCTEGSPEGAEFKTIAKAVGPTRPNVGLMARRQAARAELDSLCFPAIPHRPIVAWGSSGDAHDGAGRHCIAATVVRAVCCAIREAHRAADDALEAVVDLTNHRPFGGTADNCLGNEYHLGGIRCVTFRRRPPA